jgi:hypothetical protein
LVGNDTISGLGDADTLWGDACGKLATAQVATAADGNDKPNGCGSEREALSAA